VDQFGLRIEVNRKKVNITCTDETDSPDEIKTLEISKQIKRHGGEVNYADSQLYAQLYQRFMERDEVNFLKDVHSRVLGYQEEIEYQKSIEGLDLENTDLTAHRQQAKEATRRLNDAVIAEARTRTGVFKELKDLKLKHKKLMSENQRVRKLNSKIKDKTDETS
jgi:predicted metal-dependent hydrolase